MRKRTIEYDPLPPGPFTTVVADPPWDYSRKLSGGRNQRIQSGSSIKGG